MELRDDPRLRQILDEAADLPPSDRPDFLAKSCGNNVELRGEIEGWLKSLGEASRFLKEPTRERKAAVTSIPQSTAGSASPRGIARQIGPYKLL